MEWASFTNKGDIIGLAVAYFTFSKMRYGL